MLVVPAGGACLTKIIKNTHIFVFNLSKLKLKRNIKPSVLGGFAASLPWLLLQALKQIIFALACYLGVKMEEKRV